MTAKEEVEDVHFHAHAYAHIHVRSNQSANVREHAGTMDVTAIMMGWVRGLHFAASFPLSQSGEGV
jgi:hypothetical protein